LPPPAYAQFAGLLDRANQEPELNAQQFHVAELDANVAGDDQARVENAFENVGQTIPVRGSR